MENFFAIFPHNGKNVSTVWKTFAAARRAYFVATTLQERLGLKKPPTIMS